jgi:HD-GYP domain-containing protein (c-di-GMP phosphodiesterase class II)
MKSTCGNLKEAGYYHDIGKVTLAPELLENHQNFTKEELSEIRKHSLVGYAYSILRTGLSA